MKSPERNAAPDFEAKMRAAGRSDAAIRAFQFSYLGMVAGKTGLIPESSITPALGPLAR